MKLPWKTQLSLKENGSIGDLVEGEEWTSLCTVIFDIEDTCVYADSVVAVVNDSVTGDAEIPASEVRTPFGTCSIGGIGTARNETDELSFILLTNGELLAVSSE
jgi:hypothetical protein